MIKACKSSCSKPLVKLYVISSKLNIRHAAVSKRGIWPGKKHSDETVGIFPGSDPDGPRQVQRFSSRTNLASVSHNLQ